MALIIGSLLLLLVFQVFWLTKVWEDEVDALRKETRQVFVNSVRDIQDSLVNEIYVEPLALKLNKVKKSQNGSMTRIDISKDHLHDSAQVITFFKKEKNIERLSFESDTSLEFSFRSQFREDLDEDVGSLSLFVELASSDSLDGFTWSQQDGANIKTILESQLMRAIKKTDLPLTYDFQELKDTVKGDTRAIITHRYTDLPSGKKYAVSFQEYHGYIFQRILPQILFSVFLFCMIALAFVLIYRSLQQQWRLAQIKNDFISNITHELKTPITTVGVAIEALRSFHVLQDPAKTQEYLDISSQELNRLTILVDSVLKMALFEQKEPELKQENIDLKELIQSILDSMKLQFEKVAAQVNFRFTDADFNIWGDRLHLTSVLYNLLDNALKYSQQQPIIEMGLSTDGGNIKLTVKDEGMGISSEYRDKVFEKFFRIPTGDRHNIKGYGLGLTYVASVVDKHEGHIAIDSELGAGTCFTITLPGKHV